MFFSSNKIADLYESPLIYKKTREPIGYAFEINDETSIGKHVVKNSFSQDVFIDRLYRGDSGNYSFDCTITNQKFELNNKLAQQGKLLEALAVLTERVRLSVDKDGSIKSINHEDIQKKWEKLKDSLQARHQGKSAHAHINGIDLTITNESLFLKEIKQPKLFGLFFGGYQTMSEDDRPRPQIIGNVVKSVPMIFEENVSGTKEDKKKLERHVSIRGRMQELSKELHTEIQTYFKFLKIGNDPVFLSNYQRDIVLNLETGYPKSATLAMELINGRGYVRRKNFKIKIN